MDEQPKIVEPKSKPRRRWFQFSLRTLLIVVTLAGCGFGWLGKNVWEARRQQADVAAIEKSGGHVIYDYQIDSQGKHAPNAVPPGPAWLHALLGDDCFRRVREVHILTGHASDADLGHLAGLKTLERLSVCGPKVTDAGLEHLRGLTQLKECDVTYTSVTDAGAAKLRRALPNCEIRYPPSRPETGL